MFGRPTLMICDPDMIKEVTIRAFDHFPDRSNISTTHKIFGGKSKADQLSIRQMINASGKKKF